MVVDVIDDGKIKEIEVKGDKKAKKFKKECFNVARNKWL